MGGVCRWEDRRPRVALCVSPRRSPRRAAAPSPRTAFIIRDCECCGACAGPTQLRAPAGRGLSMRPAIRVEAGGPAAVHVCVCVRVPARDVHRGGAAVCKGPSPCVALVSFRDCPGPFQMPSVILRPLSVMPEHRPPLRTSCACLPCRVPQGVLQARTPVGEGKLPVTRCEPKPPRDGSPLGGWLGRAVEGTSEALRRLEEVAKAVGGSYCRLRH